MNRSTRQRLERVPAGKDPIAWVRYGRAVHSLAIVKGQVTMPLPQIGIHTARAIEASCYESDAGAVMVALKCETPDGCHIATHQCIIQKDGTPSQRTLKTLKEVFIWDGLDPFALCEQINAGENAAEFDIDVQADTYNGQDTVRVAWINPKGKSGGTVLKQGDKASIMAKYGAKLRALAGPQPAASAKPKPAAPPPPAAEDTRASRYGASSMETAWKAVCQATPDADNGRRGDAWRKFIAQTFPQRTQSDLTPEQWGEVAAKAPQAVAAMLSDLPI